MQPTLLPISGVCWDRLTKTTLSIQNTSRLWRMELTLIRHCEYQQFELLISAVRTVDMNTAYN
jgi:hypothetical protein